MNYKEMILSDLTKLIDAYKAKIEDYKETLRSNPIVELIDLQEEFSNRLKEGKKGKDFNEFIENSVKKEEKLKKAINKQSDYFKDEKRNEIIQYEMALRYLNDIIWREFESKKERN